MALAFALAAPVGAQRTDNNAVTQSDDAFGKSIGDQTIGIYNTFDVRGFSPTDAGNIRIEGLYFDQQAQMRDRVVAYSTIRVGLSAQSYPFPAPTGIADYTLRRPGDKLLTSVGLTYGPWEGKTGELDVQVPIAGNRLGIAAGVGYYTDGTPYGGTPKTLVTGITGRWAPATDVEILPFWSHYRDSSDEAQPLIFTSGAFLPNRIPRNRFFGQNWADYASTQDNYGVVAIARPLKFDVRLGVFRSVNITDKSAADLLFDTDPNGAVGDRLIVIENGDRSASTSGELRIARGFDSGPVHHTLIASLRARAQDRLYGGATQIDLGASRDDITDFRAVPAIADGPKTQDHVRQETGGVTYQAKWRDVGELSIGVQKTHYTKTVTDPDPAILFPESRANPWLPSVTGALYISRKLVAYAGYTRGLEESPVAPTEAVNLNEAPPAIRTEQKDGGIRWTVSPGLTTVLGVFDVSKPYFNLDSGLRFRQLGMVRHRGVEFSIAGQLAKGVSIVVGNVLIDSTISGEEVDRGLIGKKPVGSFVRHTIASVDYRLPFYQALSFDVYFEATSRRVADAANTTYVPARWIASLGGRYRFKLNDKPLLLRGQVQNVTNTFGWNVGPSGYFTPNGSRRWLLSLAADI
jgi:iron complex outermembrane receptor protein